jgi:sigma-B regulation protein RsbU (phosphoserine phosphatase)
MEDEYRTNDEIEVLAESFSMLSGKTLEYISEVKNVTAEKERIGADLSLATRIQANMLPSIFPAFPDRAEFDIYASMDPAKEVGGDFYDFFTIDDDHLCVFIADVSGKGVPASLFMVISKTLIKERARRGGTPAQILYDVNNTLCEGNTAMMFVTVWLAILDLATGELTECNAGHEKPVFIRKGGECELIKTEHGTVLGALPDMEQRDDCYVLAPGDRVFVYTDGLPEATSAEGKRLGEEKMFEIIKKYREDDNETLLKDIRKDVDDFVGEAPQFDDLTMLVVTYMGTKGE